MIIDNVMCNDIDSFEEKPYGKRMYRFSQEVVAKMNLCARYMARYSCNAEIRFVTAAKTCFVSLLAEEGAARVVVYYGDYTVGEHILESGKITRIALNVPEIVEGIDDKHNTNKRFAKGVWRLHFHNAVVSVCDIDTLGEEIRAPKKDEMPEKMMLSYGSSISHGAGSSYNPMTYVGTLAKLLGVDYMAKGVGGSCFLEPEIADDFAKRTDWDFALMELGVNMSGSFSVEKFTERFNYFADTLYKTGKKIVFLTIFPNSAIYNKMPDGENALKYNEVIREKCKEFDSKRVLLVEGDKILTSSEMLSADGIHPSTEGHVAMGYNLYNLVKKFIND